MGLQVQQPAATKSGYMWIVAGLLLTGGFIGCYFAIGDLTVDEDSPRTETLSDGRVISIGPSWPGRFDGCVVDPSQEILPNCFREPVNEGSIVKQPFSSISAGAYCVSGILILAIAAPWALMHRGRVEDKMLLFGGVGIMMGFGSFLFHGTLTSWGGWADEVSMYLLLAFIVSYDIASLRNLKFRGFLVVFLLIVLAGAVASALAADLGLYVFIGSGVVVGVWVFAAYKRFLPEAGVKRSGRSLAIAVGILGAALAVWLASNPSVAGAPTDVPYHSFWHVLSALFLVAYFLYLSSGIEPTTETTP